MTNQPLYDIIAISTIRRLILLFMRYNVELIRCKRSNPEYQEIRDRHYIPNHGTFGQQIHYLIKLDGETVGIISGASAVYAVKARDDYFGLTKENKRVALNSIINNTVFRLEKNLPNLGTQILAMWRKQIAADWEAQYHVRVHGFETFVIENETRKGCMYKADNWEYVGQTKGSTKTHNGMQNKSMRLGTEVKLIHVKKIKGTHLCTEYTPTWRLSAKEKSMLKQGG